VPVDHRTTDVGTNLEFANDRGDARFGYDWFDKYKVQDFALGPVASLAQPATATEALMMLGTSTANERRVIPYPPRKLSRIS
jgi:hypothetical protein